MSAERELEQLRQSFAAERSALENTIAKLRRQLDEACSGEKEAPAPRAPILRCSQCDSQVGPSHWSRDGERRCEKCGPFEPRATGRCETCGTAKLVADDECSWCGPGAHKP